MDFRIPPLFTIVLLNGLHTIQHIIYVLHNANIKQNLTKDIFNQKYIGEKHQYDIQKTAVSIFYRTAVCLFICKVKLYLGLPPKTKPKEKP